MKSKEISFSKNNKFVFFMFLACAFLFRFYFGLNCPSITTDEDEVQTYLVGLKSYTTQTWPYYGTDMQGGGAVYKGQMAGALQGLLVSVPLKIWPVAESPYLFLNLLTLAAWSFLAWYCRRRTPGIPPWFIFTWIYIAPWTTHFSTQVMNQSYSIVGAVLFFIGFMESVPILSRKILPLSLSNALMGFGFLWVAQLHMSWVMFVPFTAYSFYSQWKSGTVRSALLFGSLGALPLLSLLAPTYFVYGFGMVGNLHGYSAPLNTGNILALIIVIFRMLSFASFELPRFLGEHTPERLDFLLKSPWLAGPGFFLWGAGILQAGVLFFLWFLRKHPRPDWGRVKYLTLVLILGVYFLFWFSVKPPSSHRYYEALPVIMIYSFYCWEFLASKRFWRILGAVFLIASIYFQIGYAIKTSERGISVYSQYRLRMQKAIEGKDYRFLAERRPYALY